MNTKRFIDIWKRNRVRIIISISICLLFLFAIYNDKSQGSWSQSFEYVPELTRLGNKYVRVQQKSKGETECRRILEETFKLPFPTLRPAFLRNDVTGSNLELDCCNIDMKLAVEYNGEQHYNFNKNFHTSKDAFYNQKYRDKIKEELCKQHGICLIVVPHWIKHENIENYLKEELRIHGYI